MKKAKIVKKLIDMKGFNVKTFSEHAGVPYTTLRSILERGLDNTSVGNAIKICKALNITVEELENISKQDDSNFSAVYEDISTYQSTAQSKEIQTIAAHLDGEELTKEETEELNKYIDFLISKRKNNL